MPPCIYCPDAARNEANSEEHWIPEWFGTYKGAQKLKGRLCKGCNKDLGDRVDQVMARNSPEAINRRILGIQGGHDKPVPDPFLYKAGLGPLLTLRAMEDKYQPGLTADSSGKPRRLRQVIFQKGDGPPEYIALQDQFLEKGFPNDWLREAVETRKAQDARVLALMWDESVKEPAVRDELSRKVSEAFPRFEESASTAGIEVFVVDGSGELVVQPVRYELRVGDEYPRGFAKIAFHYLLNLDHTLTGMEPEFDGIKRFIKEGGHPDGFVNLRGMDFVVLPKEAEDPPNGHYLFVDPSDDGILRVRLWFFTAQKEPFNCPAVEVSLGRSPRPKFPRQGHALRVWSPARDAFDGELVELPVGCCEGEWSLMDVPKAFLASLPRIQQ